MSACTSVVFVRLSICMYVCGCASQCAYCVHALPTEKDVREVPTGDSCFFFVSASNDHNFSRYPLHSQFQYHSYLAQLPFEFPSPLSFSFPVPLPFPLPLQFPLPFLFPFRFLFPFPFASPFQFLFPCAPPPALYHFCSVLGMSTFVVIFFGSNLIKHLGWRAGALATPLSMAALAAPLFGVVVASKVNADDDNDGNDDGEC